MIPCVFQALRFISKIETVVLGFIFRAFEVGKTRCEVVTPASPLEMGH